MQTQYWLLSPSRDLLDLFNQAGKILKKSFEKDGIRRSVELYTEDGELIDEIVYA